MYWIIIILALVLTLLLVWASADVGSNIYLKVVCRGNSKQRVVALTFDDGPDQVMTPKVLDVLKKYNIKATFFLVGANIDKNSEIVKRMVAGGHIVANHTYSHRGVFPLSSKQCVMNELQQCNEAIKSCVGVWPKLFRPPFGVTNPIIGNAVRTADMTAIGWSIRSLDTVKGKSRSEICRRVESRLHSGAIILLHDRCDGADELLEGVIQAILKSNYSIISLDKMLKMNVYED